MFIPLDAMEELQMDAEAVMDRECIFIREPEKCSEWRAMIQRGDETEIAYAVGPIDVKLPKDLSEMVRDIISTETEKCWVCPVVAGRK
ncbi:MAG: hypothetical protein K2O18_10375 [Oscillospiraceae bacterium]|nr:hypothetical protein [Oscillospiraceae bacterium]